jgi:seryl-tRNA synthetase
VIDLHLLRTNPDVVRASQRARGESVEAVDALLGADERRRAAVARADEARAEQNVVSQGVRSAPAAERPGLVARARDLSAEVKRAEEAAAGAEAELREAHQRISNVIEAGAPHGGEDDYVVVRECGVRPDLESPRDHLVLGEGIGALDLPRGVKVSGARFYFRTGVGALLQWGMLQSAVAKAVTAGFVPLVPPTLVRPEVMAGTGFLGAHGDEVYRVEADDLYLVGTSEVPLAGYHMNEILDLSGGPRRYVGWSSCYRREAGSYGKDTQGIIRVHQFDKVEMFSYCPPEEAEAEHQRLLAWQEEMLTSLEIPYRVIDVAAGDLGSSAARKFDCEGWVPSQGRYRELTSTSNCTDFQARRLGIRHRDPAQGGKPRPAATLNGTLATTRWLVALWENHQQPDGSVWVPPLLRPYVGGRELLEPVDQR